MLLNYTAFNSSKDMLPEPNSVDSIMTREPRPVPSTSSKLSISINNKPGYGSLPCGLEQQVDSVYSGLRLTRMVASGASSHRILDLLEGNFVGGCTTFKEGPDKPAKASACSPVFAPIPLQRCQRTHVKENLALPVLAVLVNRHVSCRIAVANQNVSIREQA